MIQVLQSYAQQLAQDGDDLRAARFTQLAAFLAESTSIDLQRQLAGLTSYLADNSGTVSPLDIGVPAIIGARVMLACGRLAEAVAFLDAGLAAASGDVELRLEMGLLLLSADAVIPAIACLNDIVAQDRRAAIAVGEGLMRIGAYEALQAHGTMMCGDPELSARFEAWFFRGVAALHQGGTAAAATWLDEALKRAPGNPAVAANLAACQIRLGALSDAGRVLESALARRPRDIDLLANLGSLRLAQHQPALAVAAFEAALAQPALSQADREKRPALLVALADGLSALGDPMAGIPALEAADTPEAWMRRPIAAVPAICEHPRDVSAGLHDFSVQLALLRHRLDEAGPVEQKQAALAIGAASPFRLAYLGAPVSDLQWQWGRLASELAGRARPVAQQVSALPGAARARRRIGVVSAFFRPHSVWTALTRGWLESLSQDDPVELIVYATEGKIDPAVLPYFPSRVTLRTEPVGIDEWLSQIAGDAPDLLCFPEIGMDPASLTLAAHRLAPLQVALWGHPATTGLPSIDIFASGAGFEPAAAAAHYSERLVALPGLGCRYPTITSPPPQDIRPELGLPPESRVIAFCQLLNKWLPEHDVLLPSLAALAGAPDKGRVLFFADDRDAVTARFRKRLTAAFAAVGRDADADCCFVARRPEAAFLALLGSVDLYLDAPSFSGINTALQAIACGVPILTMAGEFLRNRLAYGAVMRMGWEEGVAESSADYLHHAAALLADRDARRRFQVQAAGRAHRLFDDVASMRQLWTMMINGFE